MSWVKIYTIFATAVVLTSAFRVARQNRQSTTIVECNDTYFSRTITLRPSESTIIKSFNDENGDYKNNQVCILELETEDVPLVVTYIIRYFYLEYSLNCESDSLCIHGNKYCGHILEKSAMTYVVPANNSQTIRFSSDSSNTSQGFKILITVAESGIEDAEVGYKDICGTHYTEVIMPDYTTYNDTIYSDDDDKYDRDAKR